MIFLFSLSPSEMITVAETFEGCSTDLLETAKRMSDAAKTLTSSWVGAGADEFQDDIENFRNTCDKMVEVLDEKTKALRESARVADETQAALQNQWK